MGNSVKKEWTPPSEFRQNCVQQGYRHTSPPIGYTNDRILTIDIGKDGQLYCVERLTDVALCRNKLNAAHVCIQHPVSIQANTYLDGVTIIVKKKDYHVFVLEPMADGIHVSSNDGDSMLPREFVNHPNFPRFQPTGVPDYDLLSVLFDPVYPT